MVKYFANDINQKNEFKTARLFLFENIPGILKNEQVMMASVPVHTRFAQKQLLNLEGFAPALVGPSKQRSDLSTSPLPYVVLGSTLRLAQHRLGFAVISMAVSDCCSSCCCCCCCLPSVCSASHTRYLTPGLCAEHSYNYA